MANYKYKIIGMVVLTTLITADIAVSGIRQRSSDELINSTEIIEAEPIDDNELIEYATDEETTEEYTEIQIVEEAEPESISLLDMEMLSGSVDFSEEQKINTGEIVSGFGKTFYDEIEPDQTIPFEKSAPTYYVKGKYKYFRCKLALLDKSKNSPLNTYIEIYGDDDNLIYTSPIISAGSIPVDISDVDITGNDTIKFVFVINNPNDYEYDAGMWSADMFSISWMLVEPEFYN